MSRRGAAEKTRVHLYKESFFSRWTSRILFVLCAVAFFWLGLVTTPHLQTTDNWKNLYHAITPVWLQVGEDENSDLVEVKKELAGLSKRVESLKGSIIKLKTQQISTAHNGTTKRTNKTNKTTKPAF